MLGESVVNVVLICMELHQDFWRVQFLEIVCGCVVDWGKSVILQIKHKVQHEIWEGIMTAIHVSYIYYIITVKFTGLGCMWEKLTGLC